MKLEKLKKLEKMKKEINIGMNDMFAHIPSLTGHIHLRLDDLRFTIAKSIDNYQAQLSFVTCGLNKRSPIVNRKSSNRKWSRRRQLITYNLKLITLFVILILSLVSCRDENEQMPVTREADDGLVRFSYTLSGAGVTTRFATTEAGGDFTPNDRVGIFMLDHDPSKTNEDVWTTPQWPTAMNIPYKTDAANELLPVSTSIRYPEDGSPVNFVSYYPYTPNIEQKYKIPVDVSAYTGAPADMGLLVYDGRGVAKQKGDAATFAYEPQLCKLIIVVKPEDGYNGGALTASPGLTVKGLPTKALYNLHLSTMEIPTDKTLAGTDVDVPLTPVVVNKDSVRWEALILPHTLSQAASAGRFFTFTLGGKPYEYELENETFVKGTKYRYDFTLLKGVTPDPFPTYSEDRMTNSYMVAPNGEVLFKVSRAYEYTGSAFTNRLRVENSADYTGGFDAKVLWQDPSDLIESPTSTATAISGSGNTARVKVKAKNNKSGNAVIGIYKANTSTLVWSYHIWVTDYMDGGTGKTVSMVNGHKFMDRNLGATAADLTTAAYGLLYQWGRKDPFPGAVSGAAGWNAKDSFSGLGTAAVTTKTTNAEAIIDAIQNPTTFMRHYTTLHGDWLPAGADNTLWRRSNGKKTIYDPCPAGWRVPAFVSNSMSVQNSPWMEYDDANRSTYSVTVYFAYKAACTFSRGAIETSYPTGNRRSSTGSAEQWPDVMRNWSATASGDDVGIFCHDYGYPDNHVYAMVSSPIKGWGFVVRCVREP
jgi:hypothetical protein